MNESKQEKEYKILECIRKNTLKHNIVWGSYEKDPSLCPNIFRTNTEPPSGQIVAVGKYIGRLYEMWLCRDEKALLTFYISICLVEGLSITKEIRESNYLKNSFLRLETIIQKSVRRSRKIYV